MTLDENTYNGKEYSPPTTDQWTNVLLTPSYHGQLCLGNGEHPQ